MPITNDSIAGVYKPRNPKDSAFYNCVENHFEKLESVWDNLYAPRYGFWRPYVADVIYRYLDCGDLHCGFAATTAATNIFWRFHVNVAISVRPAIRSGSPNTANGC